MSRAGTDLVRASHQDFETLLVGFQERVRTTGGPLTFEGVLKMVREVVGDLAFMTGSDTAGFTDSLQRASERSRTAAFDNNWKRWLPVVRALLAAVDILQRVRAWERSYPGIAYAAVRGKVKAPKLFTFGCKQKVVKVFTQYGKGESTSTPLLLASPLECVAISQSTSGVTLLPPFETGGSADAGPR